MNFRSLALLSCLGCLLALSKSNAQPDPPPRPFQGQAVSPAQANAVTKPIYNLMLYAIADGNTTKHFWKVSVWRAPVQSSKPGGELPVPKDAFQSLEAPQLRDWVSHLPPGSCITAVGWLGPMRNGAKGKTLGTSPSDLILSDAFKFEHFCRSKNVEFDILMGGG